MDKHVQLIKCRAQDKTQIDSSNKSTWREILSQTTVRTQKTQNSITSNRMEKHVMLAVRHTNKYINRY